MPRTVWRLTTAPYANLAGEGARRSGGRWNPKGFAAAYTADHPALCLAEYLVHVRPPWLPRGLVFLRVEIPDALPVETVAAAELGADWRDVGAPACVSRGLDWLRERRTAVLDVPSAVLPLARNVLINPVHPDAGACRIVEQSPYEIDRRLLEILAG